MNRLKCPVSKSCGGCDYIDMDYAGQLKLKQKMVEGLIKKYGKVETIVPMEEPYHYRNKVSAAFGYSRGSIISGVYEKNSHRIVNIESCLIEDKEADRIIADIRELCRSFKIKAFNEDTGYGLLRHVLVRVGKASGEIMVVLVMASPVFPGRNNFVKEIRRRHPDISTIIHNVNERSDSMVLGERNIVIYGKGYIEDMLCGLKFRISLGSFYQVNPVQTEKLYNKAIELASLSGNETVLDAYCGVGTIGMIASKKAGEVIGVELNKAAVKDAIINAKLNSIKNISFYAQDAGVFIKGLAESKKKVDVIIMDPPRAGSTKEFIDCVAKLSPVKVVYISCSPETLARDLEYFAKRGYKMEKAVPYDCFSQTKHCEVAALLSLNTD